MYPKDTAFFKDTAVSPSCQIRREGMSSFMLLHTGRPTDDEVYLPTIVYERAFLTFTPPRP